MAIAINGTDHPVPDDPRVSLLDFLRDRVGLTGTKLGCNQGACGACTVLLDGTRVLSCLTLAVQADGHEVQTRRVGHPHSGLGVRDAVRPREGARRGAGSPRVIPILPVSRACATL